MGKKGIREIRRASNRPGQSSSGDWTVKDLEKERRSGAQVGGKER